MPKRLANLIAIRVLVALSLLGATLAPYVHQHLPAPSCGKNNHPCQKACDFGCSHPELCFDLSCPLAPPEHVGCGATGHWVKNISTGLTQEEYPATEPLYLAKRSHNPLRVSFVWQGHSPHECWICRLLALSRSYVPTADLVCLFFVTFPLPELVTTVTNLPPAYCLPVARSPPRDLLSCANHAA